MKKFSTFYESKAPKIIPDDYHYEGGFDDLFKAYKDVATKCISGEYTDISNLNKQQRELVKGFILADQNNFKKSKKIINSLNESDDPSKYVEVTDEVKKLIEQTIDKSGGEFNSFVESFIKNPEEVKIEGFINESDIYDFYLKYRNQIDEVLNSIKFYQTTPEEMNVFGLYDYIIKGTQKSMEEFVKMLGEKK